MNSDTVNQLRERAESMAALSLKHLSLATRQKLFANELSVNAYSNEYGGFVFVGEPAHNEPTEPDLAELFKFAVAAGILWLRLDSDVPVIDGLPTFDEAGDVGL